MNKESKKLNYFKIFFLALLMVVVFFSGNTKFYEKEEKANKQEEKPVINEELSEIENTVKISFVGDLALSDSQYKYMLKKDNFDSTYKYVKSYLESSDYVVGFFSDNLENKIYANRLKKLGVDLLSISHAEMLVNGKDEIFNTLDTLEQMKIDYVGAYRNNEEKDTIKIIEINGIKIAVLSYLDNIKGYSIEEIEEDYSYISSMISSNSKYYNEYVSKVEADFQKVKEENVDLILVFSNIEEQYKNSASLSQDNWNQIFIENGADIILGNYSTSVHPIEYDDGSIIINSAGTLLSDDLSAIVNIYIDKESKNLLTASIVPLYVENEDNLKIIPIYNILNDSEFTKLRETIGEKELYNLIDKITKIMFGKKVSHEEITKYYYYTENDYNDIKESSLIELNEEYKDTEIYKLIEESKSVTFIGDSITEGTKNKRHPWYEELVSSFDNKKIINISRGGYTVKRIIKDYKKDILASKSDLYIVALGINDIRYRKKETCAMNGKEYVKDIEELVKLIKKSNKKAKIVLIPPWTTLPGDKSCVVDEKTKQELITSFSENLKKYADKNGYIYIDPNPYLNEFFENNDYLKYMIDVVHPNSTTGVTLYSKAIFEGSNKKS